jgi:hypothetical protein
MLHHTTKPSTCKYKNLTSHVNYSKGSFVLPSKAKILTMSVLNIISRTGTIWDAVVGTVNNAQGKQNCQCFPVDFVPYRL